MGVLKKGVARVIMERGLSASECPVCYDRLGIQRVPYSLLCGHTLCGLCIKNLSHGSETFPCPLCRELTPVNNVKRNVTLLQLITQLNEGMTPSLSHSLSIPFETIELGRLLDRGASGEVYRGVWQGNDVAIKIFSSGQLSSDAHESFKREVCIMNTLRHPNVVLLLAASPSPPKLAIVMEYVSGGSLYSHLHIDKTVLPVDTTAQLLADITRGLQYLHSINILHRDLKSKNVLLTHHPPLCKAKLCDFGLARMRLESATMTGNVGTVHWTAPEVLNCGRYQFSADIYSFGMVLYEMVARSIPFSNLPPPAVIVAVLIRRERPHFPSDSQPLFRSLFEKCTSWEPNDRPSLLAILRDLNFLLPSLSLSSSGRAEENAGFDHTDSLGHVMLDFDAGDEEDEELMKFLQGQLDNDGETEDSSNAEEFSKSFSLDNEIFEDTRGVLSQQELDDYHSYAEDELNSSTSSFTVPHLVPANSLRQAHDTLLRLHSSPEALLKRVQQEKEKGKEDKIGSEDKEGEQNKELQEDAKDYIYDRDRQLAEMMQKEERKRILDQDYRLASELQSREGLSGEYNYHRPPPPPSLPTLALPPLQRKLPLSDKKRIVFSEVRRKGHKAELKHIEPVEKRAFRVGRVLDSKTETASPGGGDGGRRVFTLQREIADFSKLWLHRIKFKEPEPPFPVGKVVSNVNKLASKINSMETKTKTDTSKFTNKKKSAQSTKEDKKPPVPPVVPPPAPPPDLTKAKGKMIKTRIIAPTQKIGGVYKGKYPMKKEASPPYTKGGKMHGDSDWKESKRKYLEQHYVPTKGGMMELDDNDYDSDDEETGIHSEGVPLTIGKKAKSPRKKELSPLSPVERYHSEGAVPTKSQVISFIDDDYDGIDVKVGSSKKQVYASKTKAATKTGADLFDDEVLSGISAEKLEVERAKNRKKRVFFKKK